MSFQIENSTSNHLSAQAVQDAQSSHSCSRSKKDGDVLASLSQDLRVIDGVYRTTMTNFAASTNSEDKQRFELSMRELEQQLLKVEQNIGEVLRRSIDSSH